MSMRTARLLGILVVAGPLIGWADVAYATHLGVSPSAPSWVKFAANALLTLHIGGGGAGLVSGATALAARKGERAHRIAGEIFSGSMLVAYAIAAGVALFLPVDQKTNFAGALLALYLLSTSWVTIKREEGGAGRFEIAAFLIALGIASTTLAFAFAGARGPTGAIVRPPSQTLCLFALVAALGAAGDFTLIVRRGVSGAARIARHLWRMCLALMTAAISFFLGQQQFMPDWIRGSPILVVLAFSPLVLMIFWLIRVRFTNWFQTNWAKA